jgi:hypothetical protein
LRFWVQMQQKKTGRTVFQGSINEPSTRSLIPLSSRIITNCFYQLNPATDSVDRCITLRTRATFVTGEA